MKTAKVFRNVRLAVNILLGCGCFLVFNDSDSFKPNLIGLACFAVLLLINPTGDAWLQANNNRKK